MIGIGSGDIAEGVSRTKAFKMIKGLGFPSPMPRSLEWYFEWASDKTLVPIVNFETLAIEIDETGMVAEMASVVDLDRKDSTRCAVITSIRNVIEKHRLTQEDV